MIKNAILLTAGVALALLGGCASESTGTVETVETSGFLSDYSMLGPGGEGEAALVYWNPQADFAAYDKIWLEPVTVWLGPDSDLQDASPEDRQRLADAFYQALHDKLSADFELEAAPGPGTMRVRIALTDADASNTTMDTLSTYVPQARLLSSAATFALGSETSAFVGEASAEGEVRDSETGALLAAAVDGRAGTKSIGDGTFDKWGDAYQAFDHWAEQFSTNLKKRRGA